ncbi:MAG: ATP-binding protein [Elusimicrobiota bacterium]|jgi:predicted AAA+ superfamily ATPase|nr:ATP-binding protein [Elusimicrobiota bacterium]
MNKNKYVIRQEYLNALISFKDKDLIKAITGIRRCGKSTLLFEIYKDWLISNGVGKDRIISVDLESIDNKDLYNYESLYKYISSKMIKGKMNYIFIDEVQNCQDFQKAVDSLYIKNNTDIYITGSNAAMFSGELATLLSGRYITVEMLPFSFKEYIEVCGNGNDLEKKYRDYVRYGSFPYIMEFDNNEKQINTYLEGAYNTVLKKDIIARRKITDISMLEDTIKFIFDNIGNIVSPKKISDTLTSHNRKISHPTIENYLSYLTDSYMAYKVGRYDIKGKEYLKSLSKYYCVDMGLRNYLLGYRDIDMGHILENIVYLELLRKGYKVFVGKIDSAEIDFIAQNQNDTIYIQVAETIKGGKDILNRELAPLKAVKDFNQRLLITTDYDANVSYYGIKHFNAYEWLLGIETKNTLKN